MSYFERIIEATHEYSSVTGISFRIVPRDDNWNTAAIASLHKLMKRQPESKRFKIDFQKDTVDIYGTDAGEHDYSYTASEPTHYEPSEDKSSSTRKRG